MSEANGVAVTLDGADYERDDPTFLADLRASQHSVALVERWLLARGLTVVRPPLYARADVAERRAYRDQGDLGIVHRVEVKHRRFPFTGRADFPHPSVLVDSCYLYDHAQPKPYAYVIVNQEQTRGLLIYTQATRAAWTRDTIYDNVKRRAREVYLCPLNKVHEIDFAAL